MKINLHQPYLHTYLIILSSTQQYKYIEMKTYNVIIKILISFLFAFKISKEFVNSIWGLHTLNVVLKIMMLVEKSKINECTWKKFYLKHCVKVTKNETKPSSIILSSKPLVLKQT